MAASTGQVQVVEGMFGGWKRPSQAGLLGLSMKATMGLFGVAVLLVILIGVGGLWAGLKLGVPLGVVVAGFSIKDRDGVSFFGKVGERMAWWQAKAEGRNVYRAGPASKVTGGRWRLPGIAAPLQLLEQQDHYGHPFGLLVCPWQRTVSVVLGCEPAGLGLVDEDESFRWVCGWSDELTNLGLDAEVVSMQVTVETAPDTGRRLQQVMLSRVDPDAPEFARRVLTDTVESHLGRSNQVSTWVTITWSTSQLGRRAKDPQALGDMVAARLPDLFGGLVAAGAGSVWALSASEIAEIVRVAFDPPAAAWFDETRAKGQTPPIAWGDVGPTTAVAAWAGYRHDSAWSKTWAMTRAPEGLVNLKVLRSLMAPHPDIPRKRVSLLYRPIPPGRAAELVDKDMKAASAARANKKGPEVIESLAFQQAQQTAAEQAAGAGLAQFGLLVTATTDRLEDKDQIDVAVKGLSSSARLRLRPMFGGQDTGFLACLPLGLMLERFSILPKGL